MAKAVGVEKVIGHTKSGKPVYSKYNHKEHRSFTEQDHLDASDLHDDGDEGEGAKHAGKAYDMHNTRGVKKSIDDDAYSR